MKQLNLVALALVILLGVPTLAISQNRTARPAKDVDAATKADGQLSIVAGKMLAFAVSSVDDAAAAPPGKWVNVYGFIYYRYTERGSGNTKANMNGLRQRMADGVATVLNADQLRAMAGMTGDQHSLEVKAALNRDRIVRELFKWRDGDGGDEALVLALAKENGQIVAQVLAQRSRVYGEVLLSLNDGQMTDLRRVRNGQHSGVVSKASGAIRSEDGSRIDKLQATLLLADVLTWATGTEEMNRVIDEGRPAVFFGFASLRAADRNSGSPSNGLRRDASRIVRNTLTPAQLGVINIW